MAMESVFITTVIGAHEGCDVACFDIPGAFLHADSDDDNLDEENKNFLNTLKRKADEVIATNELKKKNKTKATSISNGTNGFHSIDSDNSQETIVPVAIVVPKKRGPNVRQFFLMFKFINFLKFV